MLPTNITPKTKPNSYEHVQSSSNKIKSGEEISDSAIEKASSQQNCSHSSSQHQKVPQQAKSTLKDRFKALKRKKENIRRVLHYLAQKRSMYSNAYLGERLWRRAEGRAMKNVKNSNSNSKKANNLMKISTKQEMNKATISSTATRSRKTILTIKIRTHTSPTPKNPKKPTNFTHMQSTSSLPSKATSFTSR